MDEIFGVSGLYVAPASESLGRAERAMPGTETLAQILDLIPPPVDTNRSQDHDPSSRRDYAPDPVAEYTVVFEARQPFSCNTIEALLPYAQRQELLHPTFHVRFPDGHITYLRASDPPGIALLAAWTLRSEDELTPDKIITASEKLNELLLRRPEGFSLLPPSREHIQCQIDHANRIISVRPDEVALICWAHQNAPPFDGKKVWNTLRAMGFQWGDMDCFQWHDPTGQTDYLIWVEVKDGRYDYALPEGIAAGRQHFHGVRFSLSPARSPAPRHVLEQMIRAAQCFQQHIDCALFKQVDGQPVESFDEMRYAVEGLVTELEHLNVKPNSSSVCMLR